MKEYIFRFPYLDRDSLELYDSEGSTEWGPGYFRILALNSDDARRWGDTLAAWYVEHLLGDSLRGRLPGGFSMNLVIHSPGEPCRPPSWRLAATLILARFGAGSETANVTRRFATKLSRVLSQASAAFVRLRMMARSYCANTSITPRSSCASGPSFLCCARPATSAVCQLRRTASEPVVLRYSCKWDSR